jgi:hypothetical protein
VRTATPAILPRPASTQLTAYIAELAPFKVKQAPDGTLSANALAGVVNELAPHDVTDESSPPTWTLSSNWPCQHLTFPAMINGHGVVQTIGAPRTGRFTPARGSASTLVPPWTGRHAQDVRHATEEDLDRLEELLAALRRLPQLRERKRGYFSRASYAFLHFHEDAGELYVDVKLVDRFERMRVSTAIEQADFLKRVGEVLQSA